MFINNVGVACVWVLPVNRIDIWIQSVFSSHNQGKLTSFSNDYYS